jgi:hypothetical protein
MVEILEKEMTDKLLQAADAAALVRQNVDNVVKTFITEALETVGMAASRAVTWITADMHPNPDVDKKIREGFRALGYEVELIEDNRLKISWSK